MNALIELHIIYIMFIIGNQQEVQHIQRHDINTIYKNNNNWKLTWSISSVKSDTIKHYSIQVNV